MAKTRSQRLSSTVKKEEHEDKNKLEQMLHSTNNASKSKSKITKNKKPVQVQITEVKSENANDNKALLALPKKTFTRSNITAEKIAKLIGYIVNDKMNVTAAAKKAGMKERTALRYYHEYQNDPDHKIPLPKTGFNKRPSAVTQQKVEDLIRYIIHDGMNLNQAAKKLDICRKTAARYYAKYLEDPEKKIPLLDVYPGSSAKCCTQKQVTDLIGYIVNDNMSLMAASKKVKMAQSTARRYYLKYLHNPKHEIPDPYESNPNSGKPCTNDQVSSLIRYIVNDGMTLVEASVKANMGSISASKYYKQYLEDPKKNTPTPETNNKRVSSNPPTVDQLKTFFCYIIIDKLNVAQAARKAEMRLISGYKYYYRYLKSPNNQTKMKDLTYSAEKMKQLVELVQNKKMSVQAAAGLVDLCFTTAHKHYKQFLKDPQYIFPANCRSQYTQEDIKMLIDYIERDNMSLYAAAKRIKMNLTTARRYYKEYKNDPKHGIPVPRTNGQTRKNKTSEKYAKIIADIYKNNPSIKPVHGNHDALNVEVKKELEEEDRKISLKKEK